MINTARIAFSLAAYVLFSQNATAQSAVEKARLAHTAWAAWQCGTYAEMSGNAQEQVRLFHLGLEVGRSFLDALKKGQIPADVARREVPMGVSLMLEGPTLDFILGRIFEHAVRDAYDKVVKEDQGIRLEMSKWVTDGELRKSKAGTMYRTSNCALLK